MTKEFKFTYQYIESKEGLSAEQQRVVAAAHQAQQSAYVPYSNFRVGAALLLEDDRIVTGSNQENKAYPSGLCAERVALFSYGTLTDKSPIRIMGIVGEGELLNFSKSVVVSTINDSAYDFY